MLSNRWAALINQGLAIIKLTTYSIIALAGLYRLIQGSNISRANWNTPLVGDADIATYSSTTILSVIIIKKK
jgi:hypothetical protein